MLRRNDLINIFSLTAIQGSNALFPLVVFPYLAVKLGVERYAALVVSEVVVLYILTISLYSFEITGVEAVSRLNKQKKINVFTEVFHILVVRIVIMCITGCTVLLIVYVAWNSLLSLVLVWLLFPFGMILQSNFYFQAVENNLAFSLIILFSRLLSVGIIFFIINDLSTPVFAALCIGCSYVLSGLSSFGYLCYRERKTLNFNIDIKKIQYMLLKDRKIFYGNLSVVLFRNSNVPILKLLAGDTAVTLYSVCEKIVKTLQAVARPLNQFYFAKISHRIISIQEDSKAMHINKQLIWQSCKPQLFLLGVFVLLIAWGVLTTSFLGVIPVYPNKINAMLAIMSLATFFGVANFMFGSVGLNIAGLSEQLSKAIFLTGVLTLCIAVVLCYLFGDWGAAISYVLGELLLLMLILTIYFKAEFYAAR